MKCLLLLCFAVGVLCRIDNDARAQAEKDASLISNRVPDHSGHGAVQNAVCTGCQDAVAELKVLLSDPTVLDKVKAALKEVCPYFGGAEQDCINLIDDDLQSLIHQIQPLLEDPEKVCAELEMCSSAANPHVHVHKVVLQYGRRWMNSLKTKERNAILCDECTFIVGEGKRLFDDKATQDQVKKYLEDSCTTLGTLQDECKQLIDENFGKIVELVDSLLSNAKEVCGELGLCSNNGLRAFRRYAQGAKNYHQKVKMIFHPTNMPKTFAALEKIRNHQVSSVNGGCIACKFAFQTLEFFLENSNKTIMAIVGEIEKICKKLPTDVDAQCMDWLGIYGKPVVQLTIKTYLQPASVCTMLTACTSSQLTFIEEVQGTVRGEAFCFACKEVVDLTKTELATRAVQQELNDALIAATCDHINPQYKSQCTEIINGYLPQVWQVIDDSINANSICSGIKAC